MPGGKPGQSSARRQSNDDFVAADRIERVTPRHNPKRIRQHRYGCQYGRVFAEPHVAALKSAAQICIIHRGKVIHDPEDGRAGIQYPPDWPAPTGHSGSGVFLWNADAERLELVGVFYSVTGMAWGLEIGPLKLTASNHAQVLEFVPIAAAMQALNADSD